MVGVVARRAQVCCVASCACVPNVQAHRASRQWYRHLETHSDNQSPKRSDHQKFETIQIFGRSSLVIDNLILIPLADAVLRYLATSAGFSVGRSAPSTLYITQQRDHRRHRHPLVHADAHRCTARQYEAAMANIIKEIAERNQSAGAQRGDFRRDKDAAPPPTRRLHNWPSAQLLTQMQGQRQTCRRPL